MPQTWLFRVEIAPRALDDLDQITGYIKQRSFEQAQKWFFGMLAFIESREEMPTRCPLAQESGDLGREVRLLLNGRRNRSYKIYFAIDDARQTVQIFHMRHWARHALRSEIQDLMEDLHGEEGI